MQAIEFVLAFLKSAKDLAAVTCTCKVLRRCVQNSRLQVTLSSSLVPSACKLEGDVPQDASDTAHLPLRTITVHLSKVLFTFPSTFRPPSLHLVCCTASSTRPANMQPVRCAMALVALIASGDVTDQFIT
jgi:hypothetical protein